MSKALRQDGLEQLLAKIVLLKLLNDTPGPAVDHSLAKLNLRADDTQPRILSLLREKELTEALAFLANTTDDPGKVIALCTEEGADGKSLHITLAVNNGALENVVKGFRKIASILQRISRKGSFTTTPYPIFH